MSNRSSRPCYASFLLDGRESYGLVEEGGVRPVGDAIRGACPTLREAIAADRLEEVAQHAKDVRPWSDVTLLPPIPAPGKIVCVGRNYAAHAAESGHKPAEFPNLFLRLANTLVGHGGKLLRPGLSHQFDYEGELAIVIGRPGRHVASSDAMRHVAGYSCFMDGSVRDIQFGHSLAAGKNFPSTGGFGPWMTVADASDDVAGLRVRTRLNGVEMQSASCRDMIFPVPDLIAYISSITPLEAGDVIATGTPEGVGFARDPQVWLRPGDVVEVEIGGVGVLKNVVAEEGAGSD